MIAVVVVLMAVALTLVTIAVAAVQLHHVCGRLWWYLLSGVPGDGGPPVGALRARHLDDVLRALPAVPQR